MMISSVMASGCSSPLVGGGPAAPLAQTGRLAISNPITRLSILQPVDIKWRTCLKGNINLVLAFSLVSVVEGNPANFFYQFLIRFQGPDQHQQKEDTEYQQRTQSVNTDTRY